MHAPFSACNHNLGKSMRDLRICTLKLFQFFCLPRKCRKCEAFLSAVPGKRKGFHAESSRSQRRCQNNTTEKEVMRRLLKGITRKTFL